MPFRELITEELAKLLGALSHHDRLLILEELYQGEREVKALQKKLGISHSRVSQHLSLLRSHKVVIERRQGRHVFYRLIDPEISQWVMSALKFIEFRLQYTDEIMNAVEDARKLWLSPQPPKTESAPRTLIYIPGRQGEKEPPTQNEA